MQNLWRSAYGSVQVTTKTVAQCVEFYYTYKKHVKIGRNGALIYGENEPPESRTAEEEQDHKVDHVSISGVHPIFILPERPPLLNNVMDVLGRRLSPARALRLTRCFFSQAAQRLELQQQEEDSRKWDGSADRKQDVCRTRVTHTLPSTENVSVKWPTRYEGFDHCDLIAHVVFCTVYAEPFKFWYTFLPYSSLNPLKLCFKNSFKEVWTQTHLDHTE